MGIISHARFKSLRFEFVFTRLRLLLLNSLVDFCAAWLAKVDFRSRTDGQELPILARSWGPWDAIVILAAPSSMQPAAAPENGMP